MSRASSSGLIVLGGAACLAIFLFQCAVFQGASLDDPYIGFRYAANLAHGAGLVWNAGEPPVEGFTELPWVLIMAAAIKLGFQPLPAAQVIGAASGAALIVLVLSPLNTLAVRPFGRFLAAFLLACAPVCGFYAVSGMAHILFTLLVTIAALFLCRAVQDAGPRWWVASGLVFGLAAVMRPEGLGLFGVSAAFALTALLTAGLSNWRSLLGFAGAFLLFWVPFLTWRLARYGHPLPNTYYAKYSNTGLLDLPWGMLYLSNEIQGYLGIPLATSLVLFLSHIKGRQSYATNFRRHAVTIYCLTFILSLAGFTAVIGGDDVTAFPSVRLFLPALPLTFMLAAAAIETLVSGYAWAAAAAVTVLFLAGTGAAMGVDEFALAKAANPDMNYAKGPLDLLKRAFSPTGLNYAPTKLGDWIDARLSPPCSIAVPWAGRIPYEVMKCTVIDTLGLNDPHISQLAAPQRGQDVKGDPAYVLSLKPDLIFVNVLKGYAMGTQSFRDARGWKFNDQKMIALLLASKDYRLVDTDATDVTVFERIK